MCQDHRKRAATKHTESLEVGLEKERTIGGPGKEGIDRDDTPGLEPLGVLFASDHCVAPGGHCAPLDPDPVSPTVSTGPCFLTPDQ